MGDTITAPRSAPVEAGADIPRLGLWRVELHIEFVTEVNLIFRGESAGQTRALAVSSMIEVRRGRRGRRGRGRWRSSINPSEFVSLEPGETVPSTNRFLIDGDSVEDDPDYSTVGVNDSAWTVRGSEARWAEEFVLAHDQDEAIGLCAAAIPEPVWTVDRFHSFAPDVDPVELDDLSPGTMVYAADGPVDLEVARRRIAVSAAFDPNQLTLFSNP